MAAESAMKVIGAGSESARYRGGSRPTDSQGVFAGIFSRARCLY